MDKIAAMTLEVGGETTLKINIGEDGMGYARLETTIPGGEQVLSVEC